VLLLAASVTAFSQHKGEDFDILENTLESSGASSGGEFILNGTAGQPDASPQDSTTEEFSFNGGFWGAFGDLIFKDGFEQP
jgi:hypothetical protein